MKPAARSVKTIAKQIKAVVSPSRTTLVAIDGCGGAGKSTLAVRLSELLDQCAVVHCDHLLADPGKPEWRRNLKEQVIDPLLANQTARYAHLDWRNGELVERLTVEPGGIVIIEGISLLHSDLDVPWDLTVWVECPPELRLERGLSRDGEEMRSVRLNEWMPEEDGYVVAERPHECADVIYDSTA